MAIFPLRGRVRHYDWGGSAFIPKLLGREPDGRPWAEYWLGAHPGDPSEVLIDGQWQPLDAVIAADPKRWLGQEVAQQFGELPFLFKVLDVARPLSIQVHPNKQQAEAGFDRENALGIAVDAPDRNFKDRNHKPELAVALGDFWLLYGFRPVAEVQSELDRAPSLAQLATIHRQQGLRVLFETVMRAEPNMLEQWLEPILSGATISADRATAEHWFAWWASQYPDGAQRYDRGLFGFLLMNLLKLSQGDAIFQAANESHAYLYGQCLEVMANSDNVLRGGLTSKHVDIDALVAHIDFSANPATLSGPQQTPLCFPGITDFRLDRELRNNGTIQVKAADMLVVTAGEVTLDHSMTISTGQGVLVTEPQELVTSTTESADLIRISTGGS